MEEARSVWYILSPKDSELSSEADEVICKKDENVARLKAKVHSKYDNLLKGVDAPQLEVFEFGILGNLGTKRRQSCQNAYLGQRNFLSSFSTLSSKVRALRLKPIVCALDMLQAYVDCSMGSSIMPHGVHHKMLSAYESHMVVINLAQPACLGIIAR